MKMCNPLKLTVVTLAVCSMGFVTMLMAEEMLPTPTPTPVPSGTLPPPMPSGDEPDAADHAAALPQPDSAARGASAVGIAGAHNALEYFCR